MPWLEAAGVALDSQGRIKAGVESRYRYQTSQEKIFAGGDAVMGARTVVEAVAVAKKVAESMDAYMKSLPAEEVADPYANIPVFQTPTSDVLAKQEI